MCPPFLTRPSSRSTASSLRPCAVAGAVSSSSGALSAIGQPQRPLPRSAPPYAWYSSAQRPSLSLLFAKASRGRVGHIDSHNHRSSSRCPLSSLILSPHMPHASCTLLFACARSQRSEMSGAKLAQSPPSLFSVLPVRALLHVRPASFVFTVCHPCLSSKSLAWSLLALIPPPSHPVCATLRPSLALTAPRSESTWEDEIDLTTPRAGTGGTVNVETDLPYPPADLVEVDPDLAARKIAEWERRAKAVCLGRAVIARHAGPR